MAQPIININNFSKSFGNHEVVTNLSFDVQPGETFAFLGANGSGKTTTIRCLLGLLETDSGQLLINGRPYDTTMAATLGYLPEERGLYTDSQVIETMTYFGTLKGLAAPEAKKWSVDYLERVGLADKQKSKVKELSSGQQQKIQLGLTMINKPKLLVLDEPTKGLDPVNRKLLLDLLQEMKTQDSTIVFITHQMEEVEKLADRLIMIKDGKAVLYGGLQEVKERFGENRIHVNFTGRFPKNPKLYQVVSAENNVAELVPNNNIETGAIFKYLAATDLQITKFERAMPSLQELFVSIQQNHD
ncbi:MAG: ATP-binding cassette domain-containing protein [bacterium]